MNHIVIAGYLYDISGSNLAMTSFFPKLYSERIFLIGEFKPDPTYIKNVLKLSFPNQVVYRMKSLLTQFIIT